MNTERRRLLLIDQDVVMISELKQKLAESEHLAVCGEVQRSDDLLQAIQRGQPEVVMVGSLTDVDLGFLCQQIRFFYPQIVCIAACSVRESHWEPFLRNLGVWVISKPVQAAQLEMMAVHLSRNHDLTGQPSLPSTPTLGQQAAGSWGTIDQGMPATLPPKPSKEKHLITVYGPKGGVGKTFLSRELAIFFSLQKVNGRRLKVLAVDFNLDLGTIATSLNLARRPNLYNWVQNIDEQLIEMVKKEGRDPTEVAHGEWQEYSALLRLSPEDVEQYVVTHPESGLHVLTSPRDIRHSFEIKDYHLYIILETLKQSEYDVILIDTAPDTTDATIQALFFAERVVMVGNPVVDAIENIQRMLKLLREADYPEERIEICMNRLQRKEMFTLEEIRAYFQLHPGKELYTIPDDAEVKRTINTGIPLLLASGRSAAREAVAELGRSLIPSLAERQDERVEGKSRKPKERSFLFKLFQR
ncbi:AAA family ATPase [Brevibacillus humidisoli]|uniref:AAA family ATPase n=1 Tax=Brevibacillus humidisoli TaxID=2895522 RepID=UPI001E2B6CD7|nr:AAA family ATPase [Brevibacillus humidisoli]UFJ40577.1 AAA family ATPase [Brevibacillus humidisoli]